MKFLNKLYQHINILSLDVVTGAVIGALFFGRLLSVNIPLPVLAALALTVWVIYTIDHLRDARAIPTIASTDRHRFHQKNFRAISSVLVGVALLDLVLVWFLPSNVLNAGMILGSVVLLYLILQRYLKFLKEIFVACLYTAGILVPSLTYADLPFPPLHHIIIAKYLITALMNLLLFSLFDYNEDRSQQQHSFVTWFGPTSTRYGIILLGLLNIVTGFWLWFEVPKVALIFICMNLLLLAVLFFRKRLTTNNYYRILGDAVFFIPALYLV